MGLRLKFNIALLVLAMLCIAAVGVAARFYFLRDVENVATRQASLVMETASAVRDYTSKEIVPLLRDHMKLQFLPHSVPSWSAQTQLRAVTQSNPGLTYRETAMNPTNPDDRADERDIAIIRQFQDQPQLLEHIEVTEAQGSQLILARPIRLDDPACLACHSTPANAPTQMVDLYGDKNGFDWKLGDVIAVRLVSIPIKSALEAANHLILASIGIATALSLCFIVAVNIMLTSLTRPLSAMINLANVVAIGTQASAEFDGRGSADTANLADALNRMRRNLSRK